ncbi:eucalyptus isoform b-related [Anaeramoeba flamelloides]|uniref:Eucalyptus isoform b-related n=1 Tax=Anaeramoeba flamelloides TaxID=1746091 RepID=A0AAV7ZRG9_9EUKA|nr:eucalyptus isoform b-related [Anaeramoeba flamelloides]
MEQLLNTQFDELLTQFITFMLSRPKNFTNLEGSFAFRVKQKESKEEVINFQIKKGEIDLIDLSNEQKYFLFKCNQETFCGILSGELDTSVAFMLGQIEYNGEMKQIISLFNSLGLKDGLFQNFVKTQQTLHSTNTNKKENEKIEKQEKQEKTEIQEIKTEQNKKEKKEIVNENEKEIIRSKSNCLCLQQEELRFPSVELAFALRYVVWSCQQPAFECDILFQLNDVQVDSIVLRLTPNNIKIIGPEDRNDEDEEFLLVVTSQEKPLIKYLTGEYSLKEMQQLYKEEEFYFWENEKGNSQLIDTLFSLDPSKYHQFIQEENKRNKDHLQLTKENENEQKNTISHTKNGKMKRIGRNTLALLVAGVFTVKNLAMKLYHSKAIQQFRNNILRIVQELKKKEYYKKVNLKLHEIISKIRESELYSKLQYNSKNIYHRCKKSNTWHKTKNNSKIMYGKLKEKNLGTKAIKISKIAYHKTKNASQKVMNNVKETNSYNKFKQESNQLIQKINSNEKFNNAKEKSKSQLRKVNQSSTVTNFKRKINEKINEGNNILEGKKNVKINSYPFEEQSYSNVIYKEQRNFQIN